MNTRPTRCPVLSAVAFAAQRDPAGVAPFALT